MRTFPARSRLLPKLAALLFSCLAAGAALADYPERVVTVVNTWAPGGPSDAIIRPIIEKFSLKFGKPFILENRSGANGTIGATSVARAKTSIWLRPSTTGTAD